MSLSPGYYREILLPVYAFSPSSFLRLFVNISYTLTCPSRLRSCPSIVSPYLEHQQKLKLSAAVMTMTVGENSLSSAKPNQARPKADKPFEICSAVTIQHILHPVLFSFSFYLTAHCGAVQFFDQWLQTTKKITAECTAQHLLLLITLIIILTFHAPHILS